VAKKYIIWGSRGHAKVLADTLTLTGDNVCAIFDNDLKAASVVNGARIFYGTDGFEEWKQQVGSASIYYALIAIGGARGRDRIQIYDFLSFHAVNLPVLVHPSAFVAGSSNILPGTQILAQAMVSSDCFVGKACIINNRSGVDHECVIGDGCHVAPGATLCGEVNLGNNVMVGAGAVVLPRLRIGSNTIIGAGSVVTKSLPDGVVAYGNPAKIIKKN
jgi:sugar O-acyltransferase (sialic acid O-acetyltransferase NeuD family)